MADLQNGTTPSPPARAPAQGSEPNAPSAAQSKQAPKRNPRHRKNPSQSMPQFDGTVSDSVTNTMASPRSKKTQKPRQQGVAIGAFPNENTNMSQTNGHGHQPRHASVGGNVIPATPFKEQAYAGPTFQASPAPSSLPVPKFFSRSVPNVAAPQSFEARMAGEKPPESEQSSPESDNATPPPRANQQSPLDIFFNADRAEKDKPPNGSRLSPEAAARRPPATEPLHPFQQSGRSIFLREADGDGGPMLSPKTLPPNNRLSQSCRASSSPGSRQVETDSESEREAYTKNLKDLLLSNVNSTPLSNSAHRNSTQRPHTSARPVEQGFETPSPFQRSASGPSTPTPSTDQQNHYSLRYGNRNLSPLFKAIRSDTPPRPSSLRQQESASDSNPGPYNYPGAVPQPRQIPQIDPNSFSRNYLDNTIRHSQPAFPPNLPVNVHQAAPSNVSSGYSSAPVSHQQGVQASGASPRTATASGSADDIKTMEDDLRRMLKLNVLSN